MDSLSRLLTGWVLRNIADLDPSRVFYGQEVKGSSGQMPPRRLYTGLYYYAGELDKSYDYPGIATVLEGRLQVAIGKQVYQVRKGDWLVFQPAVPHWEFCLATGAMYRLMWFHFLPDQFRLTLSRYSREDDYHIDAYCMLRKSSAEGLQDAEEILRSPDQSGELLQRRLVHLLSWWLEALDTNAGQPIFHSAPFVERIWAMLAKPENLSLSVTELAKELGLTLNYVSSSFRQHTGKALKQVIQERRIEQARRLLGESAMQIKEIALLLGYADSQHFNHVFRRIVGQSPSAFRRATDTHKIDN